MFRAFLKLIYCPGALDMLLPEYSELQAGLQKQDGMELPLPSASGPAVS
jgi:hypothetical protein